MIGRRLPDGDHAADSEPGDYWRVPSGTWRARDPIGQLANLAEHVVEEHDDGTISVAPSILVSGGGKVWHGWLEAGVWREA